MRRRFEELDFQQTPRGEISLRRRYDLTARQDVFEVRLGEEYLMSSLFTAGEQALATLALDEIDRAGLHVLVGGLGLGYTAHAALADARVAEVTVLDALEPVLSWHQRGLLPDVAGLATDPRCRLQLGDFFAHVSDRPGPSYDVILVDIDHTPRHVLHPDHAAFYTPAGLRAMRRHLTAGGVFALWSDDPPDTEFTAVLAAAFATARAEVVSFANPLTRGESSNTIYLGRD